jgi:starch phosphorylase
MVAADFESYSSAQRNVDAVWRDQAQWAKLAIHNVARMGWFSSDRTIREYATDIWKVM